MQNLDHHITLPGVQYNSAQTPFSSSNPSPPLLLLPYTCLCSQEVPLSSHPFPLLLSFRGNQTSTHPFPLSPHSFFTAAGFKIEPKLLFLAFPTLRLPFFFSPCNAFLLPRGNATAHDLPLSGGKLNLAKTAKTFSHLTPGTYQYRIFKGPESHTRSAAWRWCAFLRVGIAGRGRKKGTTSASNKMLFPLPP